MDSWNAKKYLKFVESVRKSEDCCDLQNLVKVEFVENLAFEKKSGDDINCILNKITEKLGQCDRCMDCIYQHKTREKRVN